MDAGHERPSHGAKSPRRSRDLDKHRLPAALFNEICAGAVTETTMALLEKSQYSQRKLALRALIQRLEDHPDLRGTLVTPDYAWQVLATAERRDPQAVMDILLYPTVGVWLARALHHTRHDTVRERPWAELGYLHLIVAAAAVRCRIPCMIRVPVWHGVVTLPTVGQMRIPMSFPVGVAHVECREHGTRVRAGGGQVSIDFQPDVPSSAFIPVKWHVGACRGLTLATRIEDSDPYRGFGAPMPPSVLDEPDLAEWHKMLDEAWDVLTLWHSEYAREVATALRALVPIRCDLGIIGASSRAAFGGITLSATDSAIELAETLVHELQHSKLNALLALVELAHDDGETRYYAAWRDNPRPLPALLHGIYAFACDVEFMLMQRDLAREPDARLIEFAFAYRRNQLRRTVDLLQKTDNLTTQGQQLVEIITQRLIVCERATVSANLSQLVDMITTDHYALWRLWFLRPDPAVVELVSTAWLDGAPSAEVPAGCDPLIVDNDRALPAQRRNLLRAKALEPDVFAQLIHRPAALTGSTAHAAVALCLGDHQTSVAGYRARVSVNPDDLEAWVGLGLALRAQGLTRPADALLKQPELTVAAHSRIRALSGNTPDPAAFVDWISTES